MVIKMLPEQITKAWPYLKHGLQATKPAMMTLSDDGYNNILKNLLVGTLQCWAIVDQAAEDSFCGFFLTMISDDYVTGTKFMNVYDLFSFKPLQPGMLESCMEAGIEFAKSNNCNTIVAYSDIPYIIDIARKMGFKTNCVYLVKEI
jgi:hypothetical protein